MRFLLDTNACIHCLRMKESQHVRQRFVAHSAADLALAVFTAGELDYGALRSANPTKETAWVAAFAARYAVLLYDPPAAALYVRRRVTLEARGLMIGHPDLMIAAVALANGQTVVTHNVGEFSRVSGLTVVD